MTTTTAPTTPSIDIEKAKAAVYQTIDQRFHFNLYAPTYRHATLRTEIKISKAGNQYCKVSATLKEIERDDEGNPFYDESNHIVVTHVYVNYLIFMDSREKDPKKKKADFDAAIKPYMDLNGRAITTISFSGLEDKSYMNKRDQLVPSIDVQSISIESMFPVEQSILERLQEASTDPADEAPVDSPEPAGDEYEEESPF